MLERDIDLKEEFVDTWDQLIPKVMDMCAKSDSQLLSNFLSTYTLDEVSDSKCTYYHAYFIILLYISRPWTIKQLR